MSLKTRVADVPTLSSAQHDRMFSLLGSYFDGVDRERFEADLAEKQWVVLLEETGTGLVQGFSTAMIVEATVDDTPVRALFSGDTIVERRHWGDLELARGWLRFVADTIERNRGVRIYWFLISMGHRTYRVLSMFFNEFYPRHDRPTPLFERRVLDAVGRKKLGDAYGPGTGVVHHDPPREHLRPGTGEIDEDLLRNPHVRFFVESNPRHCDGDELACLAPLTLENLTRSARRLMTR